MKNIHLLFLYLFCIILVPVLAQDTPPESDYYRLETIPIPKDIKLEVGGMDVLPDGRVAVCTRMGEVWIIDQLGEGQTPEFKLFARGLHEPLGLAYAGDGVIFCAQRSELTKLIDKDLDGSADIYKTVYRWPLTGNYHEYNYGPIILPDGDMLVTLNLGWEGRGVSKAKWRGWLLQISPNGEATPIATGLRSPAGFGRTKEGAVFYAENQGDWVGSGRMTHLEKGDFAGNPAGLRWTSEPNAPLQLKPTDLDKDMGTMHEAAKRVKELKLPAVWFPHGIMGISTAAILEDTTDGKFGPFAGQLLVSDQGQSKIMRVFLEKVNGAFQGACFPFREGFASGLLRLSWAKAGQLYAGMTSRGWASTGVAPFSLQRLSWTGNLPFEMKAIRAMEDGFEIEFTESVDAQLANNPAAFEIQGFTYKYHAKYGSPIIGLENCAIRQILVTDGGKKVKLKVDNLRAGFIHEIKLKDLTSKDGKALWHDVAYYTLNNIPGQQGSTTVTAVEGNEESSSSKRMADIPAEWGGVVDQTLEIETKAGMLYSTSYLEVKAGAKVKFVLKNPDDMQHNLVIVKPGSIDKVSKLAIDLGLRGPGMNYVPDTDLVVTHTILLEPETDDVIYFKVPDIPGNYPYVCTVPGHATTMRGILKVTK